MKQYYIQYSYMCQQAGPLSFENVVDLILAGDVNEKDKIWNDEIVDWVKLTDVPEFGKTLEKRKLILEKEIVSNKKNLLIVDDDTTILELLNILFSKKYDVVLAVDGLDALRKIHRKKPDLIILDIMLPYLSGLEVLKKIRADKDTEQLPVVILTAKGSSEDKLLGVSLMANEYIPKPFSVSDLENAVKKLLKGSSVVESMAVDGRR